MAITYGTVIIRHVINDENEINDESNNAYELTVNSEDGDLHTILITSDDRWAVFLGGKRQLRIWAALSTRLERRQELHVYQPEKYAYDHDQAKACITLDGDKRFLLISCRDGRSNRIELEPLFAAIESDDGA
jgi:hypothetical protein